MHLVVGLGNPGDEYARTRHNAGFDAVDLIADEHRVGYWKTECGALTAKTSIAGQEVLLAKPQSYMNTSGGPVKQLCSAYGIKPADVVVLHDELDIDPGSIRVKFGGGLAGHNGLKSIADKLQTKDWTRIRVGIGRPPGRMQVVDWVLAAPRKEGRDDLDQGIRLAAEAVSFLLGNGLEKTQQRFN